MIWNELFGMDQGPLAMFIRGTAMYWFIFIGLRLAGRRDMGSLGSADILVVLLVADAAGDAMSGGSPSLIDAMLVVATIIGWGVIVDRLVYFSPLLQRYLTPSRICLVSNGQIQRRGLRAEYMTRGELMEELRVNGIERLDQVKAAYLESTGNFSVIRRDE